MPHSDNPENQTMNKFFGYDWDDIQRAQQGGRLSRPVVRTDDDINPDRLAHDRALLAQYGANGLRKLEYFGVLDRLQRAGLIATGDTIE